MSRAIDLSPAELAIVRAVLRAHLPPATLARVFGSRAAGSARRYCDFDLAVEGAEPVSLDAMAEIAEALSESDLPYKVDVIELRTVDPAFRGLLEPDMIALPF